MRMSQAQEVAASAKLIKSTAMDLEMAKSAEGGREGSGQGAQCPNRGATALPCWCDSRYTWQTESFRERRGGREINCFSHLLISFKESLW